jgi:hypothetical protein
VVVVVSVTGGDDCGSDDEDDRFSGTSMTVRTQRGPSSEIEGVAIGRWLSLLLTLVLLLLLLGSRLTRAVGTMLITSTSSSCSMFGLFSVFCDKDGRMFVVFVGCNVQLNIR